MKWYSVKTNRPPFDTHCLVRSEYTMGYKIATFGGCADEKYIDYSKSWYSYEYCKICNDDFQSHIEGVTHFCIPDPVEIESKHASECDHDYKIERKVSNSGLYKITTQSTECNKCHIKYSTIISVKLDNCEHDYKRNAMAVQDHNGLVTPFIVNQCTKCNEIDKDFEL